MHAHCEVIVPPTDHIEDAIESVMRPFDENSDESKHSFWDFYVIGGRFAGNKLVAKYDKEKIEEFYQWCRDEKITVSGLTCGKEEIKPVSQVATVDAKWNEMFPSDEPVPCPLFRHSNDQYAKGTNGTLAGDISTLFDASEVKCHRIIFCGPSWEASTGGRTGPLEATFMLCEDQWNGVNYMPIGWDGKVSSAVAAIEKEIENYKKKYRELLTPRDNWLAVTVDYHT